MEYKMTLILIIRKKTIEENMMNRIEWKEQATHANVYELTIINH